MHMLSFPLGPQPRSSSQVLVASHAAASTAMSPRQTIYGGRIIGAKIRAQGAREAARKPIRAADRAEHGRSRWKATVGPPSPRLRSLNASTADMAGWKSDAIAARPARAYRSTRSGVRATRRSEN